MFDDGAPPPKQAKLAHTVETVYDPASAFLSDGDDDDVPGAPDDDDDDDDGDDDDSDWDDGDEGIDDLLRDEPGPVLPKPTSVTDDVAALEALVMKTPMDHIVVGEERGSSAPRIVDDLCAFGINGDDSHEPLEAGIDNDDDDDEPEWSEPLAITEDGQVVPCPWRQTVVQVAQQQRKEMKSLIDAQFGVEGRTRRRRKGLLGGDMGKNPLLGGSGGAKEEEGVLDAAASADPGTTSAAVQSTVATPDAPGPAIAEAFADDGEGPPSPGGVDEACQSDEDAFGSTRPRSPTPPAFPVESTTPPPDSTTTPEDTTPGVSTSKRKKRRTKAQKPAGPAPTVHPIRTFTLPLPSNPPPKSTITTLDPELITLTPAERRAAFEVLLKESKISSDTPWPTAVRVLMLDRRYFGISSAKGREKAFGEYVVWKKVQEDREAEVRTEVEFLDFLRSEVAANRLPIPVAWTDVHQGCRDAGPVAAVLSAKGYVRAIELTDDLAKEQRSTHAPDLQRAHEAASREALDLIHTDATSLRTFLLTHLPDSSLLAATNSLEYAVAELRKRSPDARRHFATQRFCDAVAKTGLRPERTFASVRGELVGVPEFHLFATESDRERAWRTYTTSAQGSGGATEPNTAELAARTAAAKRREELLKLLGGP